jgi:hypothetical protein
MQGHPNKINIQDAKHNTKHSEATPTKNEYNDSRIYQMKCLDCPLKYARQTGRAFCTRYKEHIQAIRNNNCNPGYSNHLLNTGHKINP